MKPEPNNLARFAEAKAAERLKTLAANLRLAKKHPGDADPIHDLRVSIRRFNQSVRIFKDLWDHGHYRKMRRRLRKLMELCGVVRNCDIAIEVLEAAGAPASRALKTHLRKLRSAGESEVKERLQDWNFHWRSWLHAKEGKSRSIEAQAHAVVRPLQREYVKASAIAARPETNPEKLHELRLAAKHLRYTLEIFGPLAGAEWEQQIEGIREVQELLGAVNDCVTAISLIKGHAHDSAALKRLLHKRLAAFRRGAGHRLSWPANSKQKRSKD
jgi:CHAD domain-containing protein